MNQLSIFNKDEFPTLVSLKVTVPLAYLWVRQVHGVNLEQHCVKCLVADRDPRFSATKKTYKDLELRRLSAPDPKAYYLCVGHESYQLKDNYHLAFKYSKGHIIEEDRLGVNVKIKDALRIHFSEKDLDPKNTHINDLKFSTCRNFQFANWFKNNID